MTLLATILADRRRNLAPARDRTRRRRALGKKIILFVFCGYLVRTLGKYKCFVFVFDGLLDRRVVGRAARLAWSTIHLSIHHRETLIHGVGIEIIPKSVLIGGFSPQGTLAVPICTAQHQGREKFLADALVGNSKLIWCRTRNIMAIPGCVHLVELLSNKCGCNPDSTSAAVSFDGFNVGDELSVIRAVVHAIALKKS